MTIQQNTNSTSNPKAYDLSDHGLFFLNQDYRTRHKIPSCGVDLKSNQKVLSYPLNSHAITVPVDTSCLAVSTEICRT